MTDTEAAPEEVEDASSQVSAEPPMHSTRPDDVPEKFWDAASGTIRVESLLKSYQELERKFSSVSHGDDGKPTETLRARWLELLGRPEDPGAYAITPPHELLPPDPELNARLHEAGFTQSQAQMIYDLAAEYLLPTLSDAAGEVEAARQVDRLERQFGGAETWRATAQQIKSWAVAHVDPDVYQTLASSYDGVLALHQMMQASEPALIGGTEGTQGRPTIDVLHEMMRDPRYWRDRDPEFVTRVTAGFKQLFPE